MRISDELREEFSHRIRALKAHADYCDQQVVELLEQADGFKADAVRDLAKAREIQRILDASEGGPNWQQLVIQGYR